MPPLASRIIPEDEKLNMGVGRFQRDATQESVQSANSCKSTDSARGRKWTSVKHVFKRLVSSRGRSDHVVPVEEPVGAHSDSAVGYNTVLLASWWHSEWLDAHTNEKDMASYNTFVSHTRAQGVVAFILEATKSPNRRELRNALELLVGTLAVESWRRVKEAQDQTEALNGQLAEARKGVTVASKLLEGVTDALTQNVKAAETLRDDVAKFVSSCPREVEESSYAQDFMKKSIKMQKTMARYGADLNRLVEYAADTCPSLADSVAKHSNFSEERNSAKGGTNALKHSNSNRERKSAKGGRDAARNETNTGASSRGSSSTNGHRKTIKFASAIPQHEGNEDVVSGKKSSKHYNSKKAGGLGENSDD